MTSQFSAASGAAFDDAHVARAYAFRAPYAPAAIEALVALAPGRRRALDLGCGPGKLAGVLATHFDEVIAVDPSGPMLAEGRSRWPAPNIRWVQATDRDAPLDQRFDLVVSGTAVHFMDHASLFPRLAACTGLFATVGGDHPPAAPWAAAWDDAMETWLRRVGRTPDPAGMFEFGHRYEAWVDIEGQRSFTFDWVQPLAQFIAGQHSRATWARAAMGEDLAAEFDRDLELRLSPWAEDGNLRFELQTDVLWGRPRNTIRR
ncbi:MAG: class I SAM-dependent methyltransferase [Proteobacteria bacterium]|nr:class I SAM-dependent methyltransferase [Pseudomonadota bacterium]